MNDPVAAAAGSLAAHVEAEHSSEDKALLCCFEAGFQAAANQTPLVEALVGALRTTTVEAHAAHARLGWKGHPTQDCNHTDCQRYRVLLRRVREAQGKGRSS